MDCRKCGAKHITRRRAGVFSCRHCGVQPGPMQLDRGGAVLAFPSSPISQPEINAMADQDRKLAQFKLFMGKPGVSRTLLFLALFGASLVLALGVLL